MGETAHEYLYHKVWDPTSGKVRWLWDYSPTTVSVRWLVILDRSDFNFNEVNWEADFYEHVDPVDTRLSTNTVVLKYMKVHVCY